MSFIKVLLIILISSHTYAAKKEYTLQDILHYINVKNDTLNINTKLDVRRSIRFEGNSSLYISDGMPLVSTCQ